MLKKVLWTFASLLAVFCIYSSGLKIPYFGDDFEFLFLPSPPHFFYYFTHAGPINPYAYRPIEAGVLSAIQYFAGLNTIPVHAVMIFLHALIAGGVFVFMRRSGFSAVEAFFAWLFMAVSQAGVHAILSNDTLSQVSGTMFGYLGLWLLFLSLAPRNGKTLPAPSRVRNSLWYFAGLTAFAFSLFSKETSVSFLLAVGLLLTLSGFREWRSGGGLKPSILRFIPYLFVTAVYMAVRSAIVSQQPGLGEGRYDFHLGMNILKNVVLLSADAILPVSSPRFFAAVIHREFPVLAVAALGALLFLSVMVYGLRKSGRKDCASFMFLLAGICSFPVILMNHVSELYLYNMLPSLSILAGIGIGNAWRALRPFSARFTVALILGAFFLSNIAAIQSKAALMQENGERAAYLMEHIPEYVRSVPPQGRLILLNPPGSEIEYSIYHLPGFSVLKNSLFRIKQVCGRKDITMQIIDAPVLPPEETAGNPLVLRLRGSDIEILSHPHQ